MNELLELDRKRYPNAKVPCFQKWYRLSQNAHFWLWRKICNYMFGRTKKKCLVEMSSQTLIGGGVYFGHPYCITINPGAVIGCNVNIHKGVTIGQENRGSRKGTPTIGDEVWIGVNATLVGCITIGEDVLIAPGSYVNCDIPSHSVVFGNPCVIKPKENATREYINRKI